MDNKIVRISPPENFKGPELLEHATENISALREHTANDINGILGFLPEHYVKTEANRYYKEYSPNVPIAMVGKSFLKKMIGNFFLSIQSGERPMKIFDSEDDALQWLEAKIAERKINKAG